MMDGDEQGLQASETCTYTTISTSQYHDYHKYHYNHQDILAEPGPQRSDRSLRHPSGEALAGR